MVRLENGDRAPDFTATTSLGRVFSPAEIGSEPWVLVFNRYAGCPVCQMETRDLLAAEPRFTARGVRLLVVYQSDPRRLQEAFGEFAPGFTAIADPEGNLYAIYGVTTSLKGYLDPRSLGAAARATVRGHLHGRFEGRETQLPAQFAVAGDGRIALAHYGRYVGDTVPADVLLAAAAGE